MKKRKNLNITIFSLAIIILILIFISYRLLPLNKESIETSFIYSKTTGFEIEKDALTFGALVKGQSASRNITITNDKKFKVKENIRVKGEIKDSIIVSENNIRLSPHESRNITFTVNPRNDLSEYRRYSGEVIIITKRA